MGWQDTKSLLLGQIDWDEFCRRNPNDPLSAIALYAAHYPHDVAALVRAAKIQGERLRAEEVELANRLARLEEAVTPPLVGDLRAAARIADETGRPEFAKRLHEWATRIYYALECDKYDDSDIDAEPPVDDPEVDTDLDEAEDQVKAEARAAMLERIDLLRGRQARIALRAILDGEPLAAAITLAETY